MLSRKFRANRVNIEETIKTGISIHGKFLYAKISKKEVEKLGFAIVISKKNEKTSVGRHLIKRKIISYIEKNIPKILKKVSAKGGSAFSGKKTVVFFIKKTTEPLVYKEVEKDVEFILNKL